MYSNFSYLHQSNFHLHSSDGVIYVTGRVIRQVTGKVIDQVTGQVTGHSITLCGYLVDIYISIYIFMYNGNGFIHNLLQHCPPNCEDECQRYFIYRYKCL